MINRKIFATAMREYKTTALTPAFLFAVVLFPLILLGGVLVIGSLGLLDSKKSAIEGAIAVADMTEGQVVLGTLETKFDPALQDEQATARAEQIKQAMEEAMPGSSDRPEAAMAMAMLASRPAQIDLETLAPDADLTAQKARLHAEQGALLALVIAGPRTVEPAGEPAATNTPDPATPRDAANQLTPGGYDLFVAKGFDADARQDIERSINAAVVNERFLRAGLDPKLIAELSRSPRAKARTVTADSETQTNDAMQFIVPIVFMMLLWISVFTGGQYLLMSTIEEKSSRVMEVLLSAISPTELLVGKILGSGAVGLTVLAVYAGLGLVSAGQLGPTGMLSQLPLEILPWLAIYFLIAFGLFACLMAAIGSAVTDIKEAQSLMGPVMMLLMFPMILWIFIVRDPNSVFATVLSYIPFTTPFVMILRVSQTTDPVATWQIWTTAIIGILGVLAVGWAAVKIFRIGVLMYGKPPSFLDLLKWLRYG